jgi:hypothetical protein
MESIARKYRAQAEFIFVYDREEHKEHLDTVVHPSFPKGRLHDRGFLAQEMKRQFKMERRVTVDAATGGLRDRFVGGSNPTIVIGVDGRLDLILEWNDGPTLDRFLDAFLRGGGVYQPNLIERNPVRSINAPGYLGISPTRLLAPPNDKPPQALNPQR